MLINALNHILSQRDLTRFLRLFHSFGILTVVLLNDVSQLFPDWHNLRRFLLLLLTRRWSCWNLPVFWLLSGRPWSFPFSISFSFFFSSFIVSIPFISVSWRSSASFFVGALWIIVATPVSWVISSIVVVVSSVAAVRPFAWSILTITIQLSFSLLTLFFTSSDGFFHFFLFLPLSFLFHLLVFMPYSWLYVVKLLFFFFILFFSNFKTFF